MAHYGNGLCETMAHYWNGLYETMAHETMAHYWNRDMSPPDVSGNSLNLSTTNSVIMKMFQSSHSYVEIALVCNPDSNTVAYMSSTVLMLKIWSCTW